MSSISRRDDGDASDPGPTAILDQLMTARQIAGVLQMRVSTVEDYARRGLLPSVKLGRHRRFVRSQVERAIWERTDSEAVGRSDLARRVP